jgi:tetratricopeptide (TPR) repeat protein
VNPELQALSRARHLVELQRWQEAIEAVGPAIAAPGTAAEAHCVRAQCEIGLGQPRRAAKAARDALALDPYNEWAQRLLSVAYLQTGRKQDARAAAREALRLSPGSVHGYHVLALSELALKQLKGARDAAEAAVASDPHEPLAHETLGIVRTVQRDWAGAEAAYREGLRLAPQDADMAIGLAEALRRQGRRDEAAEIYLAAGRSDPTNRRVREGLGRIGLPLIGISGLLFKVGIFAGLQVLGDLRVHPLDAALIVTAVVLIGAGVTTALRYRGTRRLPDGVRRGLEAEHRNAALAWLRAEGFLLALFGLWAALDRVDQGGGAVVAIALFAAAVAAILAADHWRIGHSQGWRALIPRWRPALLRRRLR